MSRKAGALLWNRIRFIVPGAGNVPGTLDLDTGLTQLNKSFEADSFGEPSFGSPSRVQVLPQSPTPAWANITHAEPFLDPTTGTIHVVFSNAGAQVTCNGFFWDPHTLIGPGEAMTYNPPPPAQAPR